MTVDPARYAGRLDRAARDASPLPQPDAGPDITTAYQVQRALIARRVARGERIVGTKLGFTSRAKMRQMGVADLICGVLTDAMQLPDGGTVELAGLIQPRVEPELAYLLRSGIPAGVSPSGLWGCVAAVAPALEIIDSRYRDFRFALPDVIADNTSASGFVIGPWRPPDMDQRALGVVLEVDGWPVQIGSSGAILGDPARALAAAGRMAAAVGVELAAGSVLLAGAATAAEPLRAGSTVRAVVEAVGTVLLRVGGIAG